MEDFALAIYYLVIAAGSWWLVWREIKSWWRCGLFSPFSYSWTHLYIHSYVLYMYRAGQYLNTLYLNTVFKYIYCIYTLYLNTFFNMYLITVFKYFWSVFKHMYLNTFLNTFLHTPLNTNNRSSVDWSANHGFKHFNAVTCCICLLLNCSLSTLLLYFPIENVYLKHLII